MSKNAEDAIVIIDRMALNDLQSQHDRNPSQRRPSVLELNTNDAILAQNKLLSQQVELLTQQMSKLPQQMKEMQGAQIKHQVACCELCQGDHPTGYCPPPEGKEVNYVNNQNQGYQRQPPHHNNSYQRNNQGYQPSRFNNQHYQHQSPYQSTNAQGQQSQGGSSKLEETLNQFMQVSMENQKSNVAAIKNLENQVGQLAKQLAEQQTGPSFSANTHTNPKEHCKAIVTRSGKGVNNGISDEIVVEDDNEVMVENKDDEEVVGEKEELEKKEDDLVEKDKEDEEKNEKKEKNTRRNKRGDKGVSTIPLQHLTYPHAPSKNENARHYARFMDIFKQLQINIPFAEALEQMPKYAKFMKDILTKKKRYTDQETIMVDASCSAIIQRTIPKKESDPGRVTLPVTIGDVYVGKGLIDLGSSINLIPLSIVKRLGDIELKSTKMMLQLADKSITRPHGVALDLFVKVDKFFFLVDFVVIDMEEDVDAPLILGRPFMKTARMMIDIDDGLMKVRVQDEEICFNLFEAMKHPIDKKDFFKIDVIEEATQEVNDEEDSRDLEECLDGMEISKEMHPWEEEEESLKKDPKEEDQKLELKELPSHLKYVFLEEGGKKPVIISNTLSENEEESLIEVLKSNKNAIGWVLADLKGISPAYCMHTIRLGDEYKPVAQPQRRLNPVMKEVVRKEVVKRSEERRVGKECRSR